MTIWNARCGSDKDKCLKQWGKYDKRRKAEIRDHRRQFEILAQACGPDADESTYCPGNNTEHGMQLRKRPEVAEHAPAVEAGNLVRMQREGLSGGRMMVAHCLFEQSGTFKNEFRKLGYEAYDYDILDNYGETDVQIDLFSEIEGVGEGNKSIFDTINHEDIIIAFFPCTRFEAKIPLSFRGESYQMKNYTLEQKLTYAMRLHEELHRNYMVISKLVMIAIKRGLMLVIENPYTQPHYLTAYWCVKPSIIDMDRRENGDYMKKPTQFFFVNLEPKQNIIFEPLEYVEQRKHQTMTNKDGKSRQERRSEMHPQYANRFIRQYLVEWEQ